MRWALLAMALYVVYYLFAHYTFTMTRIGYVPQYTSGQCFQFDQNKKKEVDGIVTMVGELEYTVMWHKEANKRYAGPKMGYKVPIKWLDEYTHKEKCPTEWHK